MGADFWEKVFLLMMTAAVTGFLVPFIFRRIDEKKRVKQKLFEAALARQGKVIDAQVDLLERFAELVWEYQLLVASVPYYRQFEGRDLYPAALKAYEENAAPLLGKIRAEVSKALRLTERGTFEKLKAFYYERLLPLDLQTSQLAQKENDGGDVTEEWSVLQRHVVHDLYVEVDTLIDDLAKELRLSGRVAGSKLEAR